MQSPTPPKSTGVQTLYHAAWSAAASALVTLLLGVFQYVGTNTFDPHELLKYLGAGFVTAFLLVVNTVKASPALPQAEQELGQATETRLQVLEQRIAGAVPFLHTHNAPVQQQPTTPLPATTARPQFQGVPPLPQSNPNSVILPSVPQMQAQGQ